MKMAPQEIPESPDNQPGGVLLSLSSQSASLPDTAPSSPVIQPLSGPVAGVPELALDASADSPVYQGVAPSIIPVDRAFRVEPDTQDENGGAVIPLDRAFRVEPEDTTSDDQPGTPGGASSVTTQIATEANTPEGSKTSLSRFDISPDHPTTTKLKADDVFGPALKRPLTYPDGPVSTFPFPRPPPPGLDARVAPQIAALERLDIANDYPPVYDPEVDVVPDDDDLNRREITHIMHQKQNIHIAGRFPYIKLASVRMNQRLFEMNTRPHELPPPAQLAPASKVIPPRGRKSNARLLPDLRAVLSRHIDFVDLETGEGLRQYLTLLSKEYNGRKTDCLSITFQNFMVNMWNHQPVNERLGHYESEGSKKRIEAWEVDL